MGEFLGDGENGLPMDDVYRQLRPRILAFLTRRVGEKEAEDLTQEVFLKADRKRHTFQGRAALSTWVFQIAANVAKDFLRMQKPVMEFTDSFDCRDDGFSPDELVSQKEMSQCVRGYIRQIPEPYRTTLILSEYRGLKNQEIADRLGISLATAKIRLYRARQYLKRLLQKHCSFYQNERNVLNCLPKHPSV